MYTSTLKESHKCVNIYCGFLSTTSIIIKDQLLIIIESKSKIKNLKDLLVELHYNIENQELWSLFKDLLFTKFLDAGFKLF